MKLISIDLLYKKKVKKIVKKSTSRIVGYKKNTEKCIIYDDKQYNISFLNFDFCVFFRPFSFLPFINHFS